LVAIRGDGDLLGLRHCGCDLGGGDGELAVFDVNEELLSCVETYVVCQPAACDLEPEVQRAQSNPAGCSCIEIGVS